MIAHEQVGMTSRAADDVGRHRLGYGAAVIAEHATGGASDREKTDFLMPQAEFLTLSLDPPDKHFGPDDVETKAHALAHQPVSQRYQEVLGYQAAPITAFAGVKLTFGGREGIGGSWAKP